MIVTILAFIFVFALIVLAHEGGHYLAARRFGLRWRNLPSAFRLGSGVKRRVKQFMRSTLSP
jgi:membrane-associated protease RseP (regulator of RpoE activity)